MNPMPFAWNELFTRLDGQHIEIVEAVTGLVVARFSPWQAIEFGAELEDRGRRALRVEALTAERFGEVAP